MLQPHRSQLGRLTKLWRAAAAGQSCGASSGLQPASSAGRDAAVSAASAQPSSPLSCSAALERRGFAGAASAAAPRASGLLPGQRQQWHSGSLALCPVCAGSAGTAHETAPQCWGAVVPQHQLARNPGSVPSDLSSDEGVSGARSQSVGDLWISADRGVGSGSPRSRDLRGVTDGVDAEAWREESTFAPSTAAQQSHSSWCRRQLPVTPPERSARGMHHPGTARQLMWGLGHSGAAHDLGAWRQPMWGLGHSGEVAAAALQQARCFAVGSGGGAWAKGRRTKMAAIRNKDGAADTGPQLRVNGDITAPVVRLVYEDNTHQVRLCLRSWRIFRDFSVLF